MLSEVESVEMVEQQAYLSLLVGKKVVVVDEASTHYRRVGTRLKLNKVARPPRTAQVRFEADFGLSTGATYRFTHSAVKVRPPPHPTHPPHSHTHCWCVQCG